MYYLGIDSSNYSTSLSIFDSDQYRVVAAQKMMLEVKVGSTGLRQSDAVFSHVKNMPTAFKALFNGVGCPKLSGIGVSVRPRDISGSYMPCFLVGQAIAHSIAATHEIPVFEFSHQAGHIMSALFGTGLSKERSLEFLAFHVSGGTTDALDCALSENKLSITASASSLDLFAGQAVDRVGNMLGLSFPSGEYLSALAEKSNCSQYMKPLLKGCDCCLSGLQNKCQRLFDDGASREDIARYCLLSISATIESMTKKLTANSPDKIIVFAGGVLSSSVIRAELSHKFETAHFCEPVSLSSDNAVGVALLAAKEMEHI
ncbi:MAG: peptidase M22 [Oscillospiraceae bacterium]